MIVKKFGNGSWRPVTLLCRNTARQLSGISYEMVKIYEEYVQVGFEGKTLISVNLKESKYPIAHFFDKDMRDHATLYINAHNTFLKSGMLPSEMWEIISGKIS